MPAAALWRLAPLNKYRERLVAEQRRFWHGNWHESFERAVTLNPANASAHHWYARTAMQERKFDLALRQITEAQRLEPQTPSIPANKALILFHAGRPYLLTNIPTGVLKLGDQLFNAARKYVLAKWLGEDMHSGLKMAVIQHGIFGITRDK